MSIKSCLLVVSLIAVISSISCGDDHCKLHMSGAVTKDLTCTVAFTGDHEKTGVVVTAYDGLLPTPLFSFGATLSPGLSARAYTYGQDKTAGAVAVQNTKLVWVMDHNNDDKESKPDRGFFTIIVDKPGDRVQAGEAVGWQHGKGSMVIALDADTNSGASGTISTTVDYDDTVSLPNSVPNPTSGTSGTDGSSGTDGTTGSNGTSGSGGTSGSSGTDGSSGSSSGNDCTMTFTGAVTTSIPCQAAMAQHDQVSTVQFSTTDNTAGISVEIAGPVALTTYRDAAPVNTAASYLLHNGSDEWLQSFSNSDASGNMGSFSLQMTDLGTTSTRTPGTHLGIHGTFSSTMSPSAFNPATSPVQLTVHF